MGTVSTWGVTAGLLAIQLASAPVAVADNGLAALGAIPDDLGAVVVINVERFKGSPYYDRALAFFKSQDNMADDIDRVRALGFDIETQVSTVVVSAPGRANRADQVLLIDGSFDSRKLARAIRRESHRPHASYRGVRYWFQEDSVLSLVGKRLVVTSSTARMKKVIDVHRRKAKSLASRQAIQSLVARTDVDKDAWLVLSPPPTASDDDLLVGIRGLTGSADLARGLGVAFAITADSPEGAQELERKIASGKKLGENHPAVGALVKKVAVKRSDRRVAMTARFDEADLAVLGGLIAAFGTK